MRHLASAYAALRGEVKLLRKQAEEERNVMKEERKRKEEESKRNEEELRKSINQFKEEIKRKEEELRKSINQFKEESKRNEEELRKRIKQLEEESRRRTEQMSVVKEMNHISKADSSLAAPTVVSSPAAGMVVCICKSTTQLPALPSSPSLPLPFLSSSLFFILHLQILLAFLFFFFCCYFCLLLLFFFSFRFETPPLRWQTSSCQTRTDASLWGGGQAPSMRML
jgi:hypothetical protein